MPEYLPPDKNPKCQCYPKMIKAFFCQYGHMTECHYPMTCEEAECSHYEAEMEADPLYEDPDLDAIEWDDPEENKSENDRSSDQGDLP